MSKKRRKGPDIRTIEGRKNLKSEINTLSSKPTKDESFNFDESDQLRSENDNSPSQEETLPIELHRQFWRHIEDHSIKYLISVIVFLVVQWGILWAQSLKTNTRQDSQLNEISNIQDDQKKQLEKQKDVVDQGLIQSNTHQLLINQLGTDIEDLEKNIESNENRIREVEYKIRDSNNQE